MREMNRNKSKIYDLNGEKIVSKYFEKPIFLHRELFFYNLFKENPLVMTPKIHKSENINLQTYFIETEEKDVLQTVTDWAKVHSYFIENPLEDNKLLIKHDFEEVSSYVLNNLGIFGDLSKSIRSRLSKIKINKNLSTLLHGDMQNKNMVTFQGKNYYFDFEIGGLGHPARDIASMIISNPSKKKEIIKTYKESIDFNYSNIEEDLDIWLIARATQLYTIFNKKLKTEEQKKDIKDKLFWIIKNL